MSGNEKQPKHGEYWIVLDVYHGNYLVCQYYEDEYGRGWWRCGDEFPYELDFEPIRKIDLPEDEPR